MTIETPSSTSSPSPSPAASSTPAAEAAEDASSDAASSSSASPSPPTPAEGHDEEEEDSPMDNGVQEEEEDALRRRLERPEDFEDSETRRRPFREAEEALKAMKRKRKEAEDSPPAKRGRGRPPGSAKKSKDLDRDGALNGRLNGAVPPSVVDRNEELSVALAECLSSGRPERRCKTTTNTLVALSIADEALDLNFEDAFVTAASSKRAEDAGEDDDKPLKRPRKKKRKTSSSSSTCSSSASSSKSSAAAKATAAASTSPPPPPEPSGASRPQAEKKQEEGGSNEEETLARELNGKEESSSKTASASESPAQLGGKVPAAREEDDASNSCQSKEEEEEGRSKAGENVPKPREEAGESPTAEAVPDTPRRKRGRPRLSERLTVNQPPPSQPAKTETEEAAFEAPEANGRVLEDVEEKPQQTEGDVQAADEVHPAAVASKSKKAQKKFPPKGKKKRRRKKFMLSPKKKKYPGKASKKQGERQQQEEEKKAVAAEPKVERRGRPRKVVVATAADSKEISLEDSASNAKCKKAPPAVAEKRPSVLPAPLEELLPDLSPPKPQRRSGKKAPTKRAVSEKERAAQIVEEVTTAERAFSCLGCGGFFSHYGLLLRHKRSDCSGSKASTAAKHVFISGAVQNGASDPESPFRQPCPPEYSRLVSSALRRVPETTFNWMNGKLEHLSTLDSGRLDRLGGPGAVSAVNKVRLNYSGHWTTEDVWETGGWELSRDPLSWHKYETAWCENRRFLQRVSSLHWSEQRRFKEAYDRSLQSAASSSSSAKQRKRLLSSSSGDASSSSSSEERREKKLALPLLMGLKQLGRSLRYMTSAERSKAVKALKKADDKERRAEEARRERALSRAGEQLNGEWEFGHDFVCTVCCATYDELREVLHHKWDAHPFCLVAHVTLRHSIRVPPGDYIHPHLGRQLALGEWGDPASRCTKCGEEVSSDSLPSAAVAPEAGVFAVGAGRQAAFHAHVLVCGGQDNWDQALTGKSKGKKKGRKGGGGGARAPVDPEKAAEVRKARFARFEKPPPSAAQTGRMTRLQANIIKEEDKNKKTKRKKGGGKRGAVAKKASTVKSKKKTSQQAPKKTEAEEEEDAPLANGVRDEVEFEVIKWKSPVLRRPRRVMSNSTSRDYSGGDSGGGGFHSAPSSSKQQQQQQPAAAASPSAVKDEIITEDDGGKTEESCNTCESSSRHRPPRRRASIAAVGAWEAEKLEAAAAAVKRRRKTLNGAVVVVAADDGEVPSTAVKEENKGEDSEGSKAKKKRLMPGLGLDVVKTPTASSAKKGRGSSRRNSIDGGSTQHLNNGALAPDKKPSQPGSATKAKRRKTVDSVVAQESTATSEVLALETKSPTKPLSDKDPGSKKTKEPGRPRKDPKSKPSERGAPGNSEESEESDSSASSSASGTARRGGRGANSRRSSSHLLLQHHHLPQDKLVFPVEVKAYAVGRVASGESQARVARDLRCSAATLAAWWQQREELVAEAEKAASGSGSSRTPSPSPQEANGVEKPTKSPTKSPKKSPKKSPSKRAAPTTKEVPYPVVPYERNALLQEMKMRVAEVWKNKDFAKTGDKAANPAENGAPKDEEKEDKETEAKFRDEEEDKPLIPDVVALQEYNSSSSNGGLALMASSYMDEEDLEESS